MPRLDVYPMPGRGRRGYVVDVQGGLLDHLATRVVVPLLAEATVSPPISGLNPVFHIAGEPHVLLTQAIATVPAKELQAAIMSLDGYHHEITRALDVLFAGY